MTEREREREREGERVREWFLKCNFNAKFICHSLSFSDISFGSWNFLRLENEHLNNCGQFHAVRDISIRPITVNEIEEVDGEEKGPLRTLKRRASEILGITDQHPSVTAARRRSSGELGRRLSISRATRRPSVTNQDESTSVTSVSPSTDILTTGVTRKRKYICWFIR